MISQVIQATWLIIFQNYKRTRIGEEYFALSLKKFFTDVIQESGLLKKDIYDSCWFIGFTKLNYTPLLTVTSEQELEELITVVIDIRELLFSNRGLIYYLHHDSWFMR